MEQMRIRRQKKGELKTIHFRDREGIERFSLSDGESLCMMAEDGTKEIGLCRFVDGNPEHLLYAGFPCHPGAIGNMGKLVGIVAKSRNLSKKFCMMLTGLCLKLCA